MPVFLKDPSDTSGALRKFDSEDDARRAIIDLGWEQASPEEVQQRTEQRQYGGSGARAFLQSAAAGAVDAAVAPVRLAGMLGATLTGQQNKDPYGEALSGRNVSGNLAGILYELTGQGNAEAGTRLYNEEARGVAKANPLSSTAGYLGGGFLGAGGVTAASKELGNAAASAAASSVLGRTAARQAALSAITEGAAEGALLSPGQAGEQAFIEDHKLTSEQVMGALGWGTLLGGAVGGGLYGAGALYRGGKRVASGAVDAAAENARSLFSGPKVSASEETINEVGERALGTKPAEGFAGKMKDALNYLRDKAENAQATTTGVDPDAIKKYGGLRWDDQARRGRDLYLNRDAIIEGAKKDFTDALTAHGNATNEITDEVFRVAPKKERIAARLSDNAEGQLAEARSQADALEEMLQPIRQPGTRPKGAGGRKAEPIDKEAYLQTFKAEERDQVEDEVHDEVRDLLESMGGESKPGGRAWNRAEQQVLRERVAPQLEQAAANAPVDPRVGSLVDEVGHKATLREIDSFFSRQVDAIRKTADPSEAFVLLDRTKAAAQKWADTLGKYANGAAGGGRPLSPEKIAGARKLAEYLESYQEPLRQSLMNEGVWGNAAADQRAINAAATRYIESSKVFNQSFMTTESVGYMGKTAKRIARDDRVSGFLDRMGRANNAAAERHLRSHLKATSDLVSAIHEAVDLGDKAPMLAQVKASEKQLGGILDKLEHTVTVANQIDEVLKADSGGLGGAGKTVLGGMLGGPVGAVLGAGADIATNPGRMMRQAIGIQRVAKRFDTKLDEALEGIFEKAKPRPEPPPPSAGAGVRPSGDSAGQDVFKDEVSEVRARPDVAAAAEQKTGTSPVSLEGKTLEDLGALPNDGDDRQATLEGLRDSKEFAETGRAPKAFDRQGHDQGVTVVMDNGQPVLRDGRHRFTVAREKDLPSIHGTVIDGQTGETLFRGDIPMKGQPANDVNPAAASSPAPASSGRAAKAGVATAAVAVPLALRTFLGDYTDPQEAFRERAREIHEATADLGEGVRRVVSSDLGDLRRDFPQFTNSLAGGLTRGAQFLESKLPRSYRAAAPGAPGRSSRPVADHDIAKFARYWSAVHDPVSVLTDMQVGMVTAEQIEAVKTVYPELWVSLSQRLLERAAQADAQGHRLPMQTRSQIGRFVGVQIEPAFRSSVLSLLDQARGARDQGGSQQPQPRPSNPPDLAKSAGPESTQIQQRTASVY